MPVAERLALEGERFGRCRHRGLQRLLQAWRDLAADKIWNDKLRDCSWWYGERASVSQLAGAAWKLRGWAIQDYAWERRKRYAQIDLCVEHRLLGLRLIAEAKQIWPCLTRPDSLDAHVTDAFDRLEEELGHVDDMGWSRWMFVFVTPWTTRTRGVTVPLLQDFVSALGKIKGATVWTFPEWARDRNIGYPRRTAFYPGVALLARKL